MFGRFIKSYRNSAKFSSKNPYVFDTFLKSLLSVGLYYKENDIDDILPWAVPIQRSMI
jgi:hypothetical protein